MPLPAAIAGRRLMPRSQPRPTPDKAASAEIPSLAVQLQGKEPTLLQKAYAGRLSKALCFIEPKKRNLARALIKPNNNSPWEDPSQRQMAELGHGLVHLAETNEDKTELRTALRDALGGSKRFGAAFARAASTPLRPTTVQGAGDFSVSTSGTEAGINMEIMASDAHVTPVLSRILARHIEARVMSEVAGSAAIPLVRNERVEKWVEFRARKPILEAVLDKGLAT
jgi:hypothetical protein